MRKTIYLFFLGIVLMWSCGSSVEDLPELDLMKHGLPVKIKAPEGAEIEMNDLGFVKDVTVKGPGNFYIQIVGGTATTTDVSEVKQRQLESVQSGPFFDEIIAEDEQGFIFRKKISEDRENYDFRYVKIQGDMEYVFQTGLVGSFSLEEVEKMYAAVE